MREIDLASRPSTTEGEVVARMALALMTGVLGLSVLACGDLEPLPGPVEAQADGGGGPAEPGASWVGGAEAQGGADAGSAGGAGGAGGGDGYGGELVCDGPGARFATDVVETDYGSGQDYGQGFMPDIALGPPQGGGCCTGSLDVVSLGNGGTIVLGFSGNGIVDGPGVDFVVFENAFEWAEGTVFAELATVAVSDDGQTWHAFPCDALEAPWGSCAGHRPVHLDGSSLDDSQVFDAETAGGDGFDLAEIGVESARWVKITDREDLEGFDGVFDLDAVGIVNAACP